MPEAVAILIALLVLSAIIHVGMHWAWHDTTIRARSAENEVMALRAEIRHEYREARAHRTDNRTALTRLYRRSYEGVLADREHQRVPVPQEGPTDAS